MRTRFVLQIAAFSLCAATFANILRVPAEYPTIQAAVNSAFSYDTVLVASGVYAEQVECEIPLSLLGESSVDSLRPVLDPSSLPNPTVATCLLLNVGPSRVENFIFRNGPEMYPRPAEAVGGVVLNNLSVSFVNCSFDSTNVAIHRIFACPLTLAGCDFENCVSASIGGDRSYIIATSCTFKKHGLNCGSGSSFVQCVFDSVSPRYALNPTGDFYMESCIIEHHISSTWSSIDGGHINPTILNCIFRDSAPARGVISVSRECSGDMVIVNNLFENIIPSTELGRTGIVWGCENGGGSGGTVRIEDNTFLNSASGQNGKCIIGHSSNVNLEHNRFINIGGVEPTVAFLSSDVIARENMFINTSFAMFSERDCDARFNYWGHASGPYHPLFNPNGLGDQVSDSVWFFPWYQDTLFLPADESPVPLPNAFELSVFPNPFNSTARISIFAPAPFIGSVTLTNILGQQVRELHRGPLYAHETFHINADNLPSGIYFLSIRDIIKNSVDLSQKVALIR